MSEVRVRFQDVWKAYPRWQAHEASLRGLLSRRLLGIFGARERRWALKGVNLELRSGESVGVIGHNGAGKSTLLRLASGVGRPTRGRVLLAENSASVLSLGDLFDFELTGRENALTAAMTAGVRAREARARLPAVLRFAELEDFADAPVRTYSEGMRLRLAFGVVAQLEPEVLLLDEVIAVGDLRFQQRCMDYVHERQAAGTSIVFASHSLEQVATDFDRALWLHAGSVRGYGEARDIVEEYRRAAQTETIARTPSGAPSGELELRRNRLGSQEVVIEDVTIHDGTGAVVGEIASGAPVEISFTVQRRDEGADGPPIVGVTLLRAADGLKCYDTSTEGDGVALGELHEARRVRLAFGHLDLLPGLYHVDVGVYHPTWDYAYDYHSQVYPLRVTGASPDAGVFRPPHRWRVD